MNATAQVIEPSDVDAYVRPFLDLWFRLAAAGELLEIRPLNKRPGCRALRQVWAANARDALVAIEERVAHGDDVYVGALPRKRAGGKEADVGRRVWVWADVDYGATGHAAPAEYATRAEALGAISALPIEPTMVVDTGGGFHVWIALDGEPSAGDWQDMIERLCSALRADDNAIDAPRILRVPGTANRKTGDARPVRTVACSGRLHAPAAVLAALPAVPQLESDVRPANGNQGAQGAARAQLGGEAGQLGRGSGAALGHAAQLGRGAGSAASAGSSAASGAGPRPFDRGNDVPIVEVMSWLGVKLHRQGPRLFCACPVHGGTNPNQMVVGGTSNVATCFGDCGRTYGPVDIVAAVHRVEPRAAVNLMAERFGFDGFKEAKERVAPVVPIRASAPDGWQAQLSRDGRGAIVSTMGNVWLIIANDPHLAGRIRLNEMRGSAEYDGGPIVNATIADIRRHVEFAYRFSPTIDNTWQAVELCAAENKYHPVRAYLDGLTWDGAPRIDRVAREVLGVKEADCGPLVQRMIRCWFISAIARAREPGCKVDTALVLVGPQGFYKSTFFRTLGAPWFLDTAIDLSNKDAFLQLSKAWIYEWPEIETITSRNQAGSVKAFVTSQYDTFRPPYGRSIVDVPRGCVIVGTTNEDRFLNDATGSRRFWVVTVGKPVDIELLSSWRDQLWAEASHAFADAAQWWLDAVDDAAREDAADEHFLGDAWEEPISTWLERPRDKVTTADILSLALSIPAGQQTPQNLQRVGTIMRRLGYVPARQRVKASSDRERVLRVWKRTE